MVKQEKYIEAHNIKLKVEDLSKERIEVQEALKSRKLDLLM